MFRIHIQTNSEKEKDNQENEPLPVAEAPGVPEAKQGA